MKNKYEVLSTRQKIFRLCTALAVGVTSLTACGTFKKTEAQVLVEKTAMVGQGLIPKASATEQPTFTYQTVPVSPDDDLGCESVEEREGALAVNMRQRMEKTGNPYDSLGRNFIIRDKNGIQKSNYNYYLDPDPILEEGDQICEV